MIKAEGVGGGGGGVSLTRDLGSCPIIIVVYYIISLYVYSRRRRCSVPGRCERLPLRVSWGRTIPGNRGTVLGLAGEENGDRVNLTSVTSIPVCIILLYLYIIQTDRTYCHMHIIITLQYVM